MSNKNLITGDLTNPEGEALDYTYQASRMKRTKGVVIIGHGVTANKDRDWAVVLADALGAAGYGSVRFSFSGNGDSEGDFRASCPTKQAGDASAVLDFVTDEYDGPVYYAGHSMGAAVGVLLASSDTRLEGLISLAGMVHTGDFAQRKFGDQTPDQSLMWDKPECPLSQAFMDDMRAVDSVLDLASRIQVRWLLIHGSADSVVPLTESQQIAAQAPDAQLQVITNADHVFTNSAKVMASVVCDWI
ncbi:MAG: pimeloyl-ACP methyl ester carboxylesterase [Planctomycetota bacterium]|jgi:pimeloyl-ACP methyl ester carboxylesterase